MIKSKFKIPDAMKLSGGFHLSDRQIAELELKETQMKFSGRYIPPEERGNMISKEDALAQLSETVMPGQAPMRHENVGLGLYPGMIISLNYETGNQRRSVSGGFISPRE